MSKMGNHIPVTVCGTWYRSITECCYALEVGISTVYNKLRSDASMTPEQAILASMPDIYEVDGKIYKTIKAIAEEYKLPYQSLRSRIRLGWTVHEAVHTPICTSHFNVKRFELNGKLYTAKELQQITGLKLTYIYRKFGEYSVDSPNKKREVKNSEKM